VKCITCLECGWVYFAVSREHAEAEVSKFNEYFDGLSKVTQEEFYGGRKASIQQYEVCWCGNPYTNFRESLPGDCPDGVTLNPIIYEETNEPA
jgi:hypothetical protein